MAIESDDAALGVTTDAAGNERDLQAEPVVTFTGWVKTDGETLRLFTHPWFVEWLEIPTSAVVHQVKGAERPHAEFRSTLWVLASADVTSYVAEPTGDDQRAQPADDGEQAPDHAKLAGKPIDRRTAGRVAQAARKIHLPPP